MWAADGGKRGEWVNKYSLCGSAECMVDSDMLLSDYAWCWINIWSLWADAEWVLRGKGSISEWYLDEIIGDIVLGPYGLVLEELREPSFQETRYELQIYEILF